MNEQQVAGFILIVFGLFLYGGYATFRIADRHIDLLRAGCATSLRRVFWDSPLRHKLGMTYIVAAVTGGVAFISYHVFLSIFMFAIALFKFLKEVI